MLILTIYNDFQLNIYPGTGNKVWGWWWWCHNENLAFCIGPNIFLKVHVLELEYKIGGLFMEMFHYCLHPSTQIAHSSHKKVKFCFCIYHLLYILEFRGSKPPLILVVFVFKIKTHIQIYRKTGQAFNIDKVNNHIWRLLMFFCPFKDLKCQYFSTEVWGWLGHNPWLLTNLRGLNWVRLISC